MPGPILHQSAAVTCGHGGQATPGMPVPRVRVSGMPVVTVLTPHIVAGCPFTNAPGPCLSGQWVSGATRVFAMGLPVAIPTGIGQCAPNGAPLLTVAVQPRVTAT
jgi:hypothetical protein